VARFSSSGTCLARAALAHTSSRPAWGLDHGRWRRISVLDPQRQAALVWAWGLPGPMDRASRVARLCHSTCRAGGEGAVAAWAGALLKRAGHAVSTDGNAAHRGRSLGRRRRGYANVLCCSPWVRATVGGVGWLLGGGLFTGPWGAACEPGLISGGLGSGWPPLQQRANRGLPGAVLQHQRLAGSAA